MADIDRRQFAWQFAAGGSLLALTRSVTASGGAIRQFETNGDAYTRGQQQGKAFRHLFLPWAERLLTVRAKRQGLPSQAAYVRHIEKNVRRWRDHMQAECPEAIEECRGLQAALDIDESTFFAVHFNTELPDNPPRCTVVGLRDSKSRPIIGKTDDVADWEVGMNVLEVASAAKGYRHAHFHFAGTIWTVAGMNEQGLSMGMNGIPAPIVDGPGLSSLTALHTILPNCATVKDAVDHIRGLRLNCGGFSLLLGDATGQIGLVEKTPAGTAVLPEQRKGAFVHANDILDADLAAKNPPSQEPIESNSRRRYENVLRRLSDGADVEQVLRDRASRGAVCQRGEDNMYTDFAVMFTPMEKKFKFWAGQAPTPTMETVELKAIFR